MKLKDLYNPKGYTAIQTTKGEFIEAGENQGFQFYYKDGDLSKAITKAELWQEVDGFLHKVKGWTTTVLACY